MLRTNKPLDLSPNEEKEFEEARISHICPEALVKTDKRVGDHFHITGKYRGAAHNNCYLNYASMRFFRGSADFRFFHAEFRSFFRSV